MEKLCNICWNESELITHQFFEIGYCWRCEIIVITCEVISITQSLITSSDGGGDSLCYLPNSE